MKLYKNYENVKKNIVFKFISVAKAASLKELLDKTVSYEQLELEIFSH